MKLNRAASTLVIAAILMTAGCARHVSAPVPGQLNTFDAYAYRVLADAQAAINSFRASVTSGAVAETPAVKSALNQAITDYNSANIAYQAWHAAGGTGATAPIASSLTQLNADITNIQVAGGK